jgi:hypothetical protein
MGAFLSSIQVAPGRPPPSQIIDVMSIYHPFPLRLDSLNKGAPVQYDACLQLGEFPSDKYKGNTVVVLFPLKVKRDPGSKGRFMNDIATKIPTILGQQPDPINGYPDVPAHTGADWSIEDILFMQNKAGETVSRAFYAWINKTPFPVGVVVMAEPVYISQTNMDAIKRLPITPPSDVIHEIGTPILYKPGPIFDEDGNPQPCPATATDVAQKAMSSIVQPPLPPKKGGIDLDLFFQIVLGALGTLVVILGVWMGIKFAMGPGKTIMKNLGDSLGRSLAGGYDALKKVNLPTVPPIPKIPQSVKDSVNKTRRNLGNRLGLGATGNFGTKRQPQKDSSLADVFPDIKSTRDLKMTSNPLFNKDKTLRNSKRGSISSIANLPATNIPEPAPAPAPAPAPVQSVERIIDDMPAGVTVNPVVERRRSAQNKRRSSVGSIKNIPQITSVKPPENTPAAIANLPTPTVGRVSVAQQLRDALNEPSKEPPKNAAVSEIEDIQRRDERRKQATSNALRKISASSQARKSQSNSFKDIANRARAVNEIDEWESPAPAPAPAPASEPAPAQEPGINKLWQRRFAKRDQQKANPKPRFKGGRKLRNRRKTAHRKKTGRRI